MPYVISEPCIGVKEGACVDVCPAACIHTTPDAPQNYIDPDVCIECEQCVLVCPVDAIFLDVELPDEWRNYAGVNAQFFQENKAAQALSPEQGQEMVEAIQAYARRRGLAVAVVVLDGSGQTVASSAMEGAPSSALEE